MRTHIPVANNSQVMVPLPLVRALIDLGEAVATFRTRAEALPAGGRRLAPVARLPEPPPPDSIDRDLVGLRRAH